MQVCTSHSTGFRHESWLELGTRKRRERAFLLINRDQNIMRQIFSFWFEKF